MPPSFSVDVDIGRSMLLIRIEGFFSIADVRTLALQRNAAVARLRCRQNQHITLCDARGAKLSTPEVAAEFKRLLADPRFASRRLAYVADGALARMQAGRVLGRDDIGFFEAREPAMAWLLDKTVAAQSAADTAGWRAPG